MMRLRGSIRRSFAAAFATASLVSGAVRAQGIDVSAHIALHGADLEPSAGDRATEVANVVVWLSPIEESAPAGLPATSPRPFTLIQKNKQFTPHLLVVPTGSSVDFPNLDPFFHNVFSLFNGKRFDLGLYEAGSHRAVSFDREGVSYIFCNIHPQMGAVVIALSTPFFAISKPDGSVLIRGVRPGIYRLHVWAENIAVEQLTQLQRNLTIDGAHAEVGTLHLEASHDKMIEHANKFGQPYPVDPKPVY